MGIVVALVKIVDIGRWRTAEAPPAAAPAAAAAVAAAPAWRLAVNRFNMAMLQAPDGRAVKGRIVFADAPPSASQTEVVRVESVWGAAGLAVGLGFAPVGVEVLLWPAGGASGGDALAVASVGAAAAAAAGGGEAPLPEARDLVFVREAAAR